MEEAKAYARRIVTPMYGPTDVPTSYEEGGLKYVARHYEAGVRAERERCAQVCRARAEIYRQERDRRITELLRDALEEAIAECEACAEAIERGEG